MEDKELIQLIQRGHLDISLEELKELNPHKCKKCRNTYFGTIDGKPIPYPCCRRHEQSNKDAKIKTERDQARLDLAEAVRMLRVLNIKLNYENIKGFIRKYEAEEWD